ncbi:hypothetical protein FJ208_02705, partial [Candidatus Gribaldobacteria bacterium]|nr:hypothetical protein [Candidatus Gribaldobacteria bacterium]
MKKNFQKQILKLAEDFFRKAGFAVKLELGLMKIKNPMNGNSEEDFFGRAPLVDFWQVDLRIDSEDDQALIGKQGQTLADLQVILKKIFRKKIGGNVVLRVDVNQYRANKERYLMDLAIESANEAAIKQKEIILPEMSSFDRRIIHSALKTRK